MRKTLLISALLLGFAAPAMASGYVWKDKANGFTFSFPDNWGVQTPESPATLVRIAGPLNEDMATCNVNTTKDGRTLIYPKPLMQLAVQEKLNQAFWEDEILGEGHENAQITAYIAPAGLGGKGNATAVRASYTTRDENGVNVPIYAQIIASIYNDTRYVVSCSARADQFEKYLPVFTTIMGSVDLDGRYQPFANGYYRDFLADPVSYRPYRSKPGSPDAGETTWWDRVVHVFN